MNNTPNTNSIMSTKAYIGHGTRHQQFDIVDVVLDVEKFQEHIFEYEGRRYLKVSVASRKEPGKYGATHTVYVRTRSENAVSEPEPEAKPARRKDKKKA